MCHKCLKIRVIKRRINSRNINTTKPSINLGINHESKEASQTTIKKLDKLESDREKLIDKLAKALDKLDKKVATKKTSAKKSATKKAPAKKVPAKKAAAKKAPAKKAAAKKVPAKKVVSTNEAS